MAQPYQPTDRRPIAVRGWPVWRRTAAWLARRGVSPNAISIAGMVAGILAGAAFAVTSAYASEECGCDRGLFAMAALFIQLRLLANLLDGMVALEAGTASPVGELYNDVPDRVSDAATLIGAGYAVGGEPALGFLAACVALFTAYVRVMGKTAGAAQEFCGPMAKQQRMFLLTVTAMYLAIAPRSWPPLVGDPPRWGLMALVLAVIIVGGVFTAMRRLSRIARQLRTPRP